MLVGRAESHVGVDLAEVHAYSFRTRATQFDVLNGEASSSGSTGNYGGFKVDREGVQIAHTMLMFQWQDGKKVIVWPEELAALKARFPTPPWSQRP